MRVRGDAESLSVQYSLLLPRLSIRACLRACPPFPRIYLFLFLFSSLEA